MDTNTYKKEIELYIHIPFCVRKCNYCDFLSFPSNDDAQLEYIKALCAEIVYRGKNFSDYTVSSIYIGGGTPSCVNTRHIISIMETLADTFTINKEAEITIECNPGTVTREKLNIYKSLGINRLSFGVQSTNNDELKILGRIHDYKSFLVSLDSALHEGFDNISADIMFGLPGQTVDTLRKTLKDITKFNLKHISVYSLIIEENTPFYDRYYDDYILQCQGKLTSFLPSEEQLCEMTDFVGAYLRNRGYFQYEISNYSKKGYECLHNLGYWKRKEYIGFGIGAASLIDETRYANITDIDKYIKNYLRTNPISEYSERVNLTLDEQMSEFMMLGFRMVNGISTADFYNSFGRTIESVYKEQIDKLIGQGLIINDGNFIKPTYRGLELQNIIAREF